MKTNLPVTQHEVELRDDAMIVSKTDLKGRITYVNREFIEVTGYAEAELVGESHNIVRHPDMPPEVFRDLWDTLKAGRPWIGVVKNRCKNGDHYWVEAHVTPIYDGGRVAGYLSVRRKADTAQVRAAEAAYAAFREGKAGDRVIRHGRVTGRRAGLLSDITIRGRLWATFAVIALLLFAAAVAGLATLAADRQALAESHEQFLLPSQRLGVLMGLLRENRAQVLLSLQHAPESKYATAHDHGVKMHLDIIDRDLAEADALWAEYQKSLRDARHRELVRAFGEARAAFVTEGVRPARVALEAGDYDRANVLLLNSMNPLFARVHDSGAALRAHNADSAGARYLDQQNRHEALRNAALLAAAAFLALGAWLTVLLVRAITRPLDAARQAFIRIGQGDNEGWIDIARDDEVGRLLQGIESMQTRLGFDAVEARRVADEMLRIKIALDHVVTPVRIAAPDGTVVYINHALREMLRRIEPALRERVPDFSAETMVGRSVGIFYDDPAAALQRLRELTEERRTEMDIGGRTFLVVTNPVVNAAGEFIASVGEWRDRTDELAAERDVAALVEATRRGDFSHRITLEGKSGFFLQLSEGLNRMAGATAAGLQAIAEALGALARGDLTRRVDGDFEGTLGELRDGTNATAERLRELVGRIKEASDAIGIASAQIAAGNQDLSSRTEEQASSLQETAASMEQINATVKQNADNARRASELARSSNEIASRGGQMVRRVVDTMGAIQDSSRKIADIVGVIDNIAFQTNILALNAAVEAARAGEQGRGFAVVATEVRNLAKRSAVAAKEIKALIAESVDKIEGGARLVGQAGGTMDDVVTSFHQVAELMTGIDGASREQATGVEQVTQAIVQMDDVTQQNAALVEQAAAAAEALEEQARGLVEAVDLFKLAEGGTRLPGPALRDATPRRLGRAAAPRTLKQVLPSAAARGIAPPHLDGIEDEWEEF